MEVGRRGKTNKHMDSILTKVIMRAMMRVDDAQMLRNKTLFNDKCSRLAGELGAIAISNKVLQLQEIPASCCNFRIKQAQGVPNNVFIPNESVVCHKSLFKQFKEVCLKMSTRPMRFHVQF